jgi:ribosomal protein S3
VIERPAQTARITIHTARPGIVIGKKGEDVDKLRKVLASKMGVPVHINIEEIRKPDLDARLVAQNVAQQLERRVMFRRAMKRVVQNAMRQGAEASRYRSAVASAVLRLRARSGIARAACRCTRCAQISITRPTRRHHLRRPWREGLDLQG